MNIEHKEVIKPLSKSCKISLIHWSIILVVLLVMMLTLDRKIKDDNILIYPLVFFLLSGIPAIFAFVIGLFERKKENIRRVGLGIILSLLYIVLWTSILENIIRTLNELITKN